MLRHGALLPERVSADCAVDGCGRRAVTRGWCHGHSLRWSRTGEVQADRPLRRPERDDGAVEGCGDGAVSGGLCRAHARRRRLYGDPEGGRPRRLRTPEGGCVSHGYGKVPVVPAERHLVPDGRLHELEHRLVVARRLGRPLRTDEVVHHRNGDRLDNSPEDLELWTTAQPKGQRVEDQLAWAWAIVRRYDPEVSDDLDPETGLPQEWSAGQGQQQQEPATSGDGLLDVPPNGFEPSLPP